MLVVDDDDLFLRFCNRMLEEAQFTVQTAPNGNEAIAMAAKYAYDVILMDINMPLNQRPCVYRGVQKRAQQNRGHYRNQQRRLADGRRSNEAGRG